MWTVEKDVEVSRRAPNRFVWFMSLLLAAPVAAQVPAGAPLPSDAAQPTVQDADAAPVGVAGADGALASVGTVGAAEEFAETELSEVILHDRVSRAEDLGRSLPALRIDAPFLTNPNLYVRGIGQQHFYDDFTAPVAVYVDGVYANAPAGQLLESFDLAGATLLKGAQGSLYARNATAGALLLRSNRPDGEFSTTATVRYGNYNTFEVEGAVGFPMLAEMLSGRIAGTAHFRDGVTRNECAGAPAEPGQPQPRCDLGNAFWFTANPNPDLFPIAALGDFDDLQRHTNGVDDWAARGLLRFQPADSHDWLLKVHGEGNRGDSWHLQMLGTDRTSGVNNQNFSEDTYPRFDTDPFVGWYDQDGMDRLDRWGVSLTGDVDIGAAHLTSITASEAKNHLVQDEGDATPGTLLATDWHDKIGQLSQELRLDGGGARHGWTIGGEFLYSETETLNVFKFVNLDHIEQSIRQSLLSFAPYFRGSWAFSEAWSAELGGRFNWEQRTFKLGTELLDLVRLEDPDPGSPTGFRYRSGWDDCCGDAVSKLKLDPISTRDTWAAPTGDATLNFSPVEDLRFYAKYTRGWKGAQFYSESRIRYPSIQYQSIHRARPESVNAFEGGLRSSWLDGAIGFDAAVFYSAYSDMQVFDMANEVDRSSVKQLLSAGAEVLGVDAELVVRPLPGLFTQIAFGWLDAEYADFVVNKQVAPLFQGQAGRPRQRLFDYSGNPLSGAPRYRLSGRVDYNASLGRFGALLPSFFFRYQSKTYLDIQKKEELSQPAFWVLDARVAYRTPGEHFEIAGWVRNMLDEHYRTDAFDQSIGAKEILYVYADPRLFGASVTFAW